MQWTKILSITGMAWMLSHCMTYDFSRHVVKQGNLIPQEKINRLHTGMNKEDVAVLMGTSLLSPTFNQSRWDYAYTVKVGNQPIILKRVSLVFKNGKLAGIEQ